MSAETEAEAPAVETAAVETEAVEAGTEVLAAEAPAAEAGTEAPPVETTKAGATEAAPAKTSAAVAAMRARVLGTTAQQLDLADEANAGEVEDPTLLAHMESARRRLAEQEKAMLRLPRLEELRLSYLTTMRSLSTLVRDLDDGHQARREDAELGHRQARVLADYAAGRAPRGAPRLAPAAAADPATRAAMAAAAKAAAAGAESFDALQATVADSKQRLFVLRRAVETVGDGLLELVEAVEEDRRRLREFLLVAGRSKAATDVAEPPNHLSERLLTSSVLPEETGLTSTDGYSDV